MCCSYAVCNVLLGLLSADTFTNVSLKYCRDGSVHNMLLCGFYINNKAHTSLVSADINPVISDHQFS